MQVNEKEKSTANELEEVVEEIKGKGKKGTKKKK